MEIKTHFTKSVAYLKFVPSIFLIQDIFFFFFEKIRFYSLLVINNNVLRKRKI
jgi:hypothetical protein